RPRRRTRCPYTTLFRSAMGLAALLLAAGAGGCGEVTEELGRLPEMARAAPELGFECGAGLHAWAYPALEFRHGPIVLARPGTLRSEEHTSELQSRFDLV